MTLLIYCTSDIAPCVPGRCHSVWVSPFLRGAVMDQAETSEESIADERNFVVLLHRLFCSFISLYVLFWGENQC